MQIFKIIFSLILIFFDLHYLYGNDFIEEYNLKCGFYFKNIGQLRNDILYYAETNLFKIYFRKNDLILQFEIKNEIKNLYLKFENASLENLIAIEKVKTKFNFIKGKDQKNWQKNVPLYKKIIIKELYRGIDLVFDENFWHLDLKNKDNDFKKLKIVVDSSLQIKYLEKHFEFSLNSKIYKIKYPSIEINKNENCKKANEQYLIWGTFLGGTGIDKIHSLKVNENEEILVSGFSFSFDIPVPNGYDQTKDSLSDGYIAKLSSNGADLLWATFIGGEGHDFIYNLKLDYNGNVIVSGYTNSQDFPTLNGFDMDYNGGEFDGFVLKISSDGSDLLWSTYLGGKDFDCIYALDLDFKDNIIVGGATGSEDFPTKNAFDLSFNYGNSDGFISKISSNGKNLLWSTYIGGENWDQIESIVIDNSENIIGGGWTNSLELPLINGFDNTYNGGDTDGYIIKLSKMGTNIIWSTYLGGKTFDYIFSIDKDSAGNVVVGGATEDLWFPDGYDLTYNGLEDAFVSKISEDGKQIIWGTYLGGMLDEEIRVVKVDSEDNVFAAGWTFSYDMPVPNGMDQTFNGGTGDSFISKFSSDGKNLLWGTYFGGVDRDEIFAIDLDSYGNILIAGWTLSPNLPFSDGYDLSFNGNTDGFIAKITDPSFIESFPIADFIWYPEYPSENEEIQFIDLSKKYPQQWQWDFGNGDFSNKKNPRYKYVQKGNYNVTLVASNDFGTSTKIKTISISGNPEKKYSQWIAVSTHASGANGSEWRSDIGIINKENKASEIDFYLYTSEKTVKFSDTIQANSSLIYKDVVFLFNFIGSGAIEVKSDINFILTSRTYNQTANGTFGQFLDGYFRAQGLGEGEEGFLSQLTENQDFRTNIGLTNTGENQANITVYFYNSSGELLGTKTVVLNPHTFYQLLQPLKDCSQGSNLSSCYAKIKVNRGDGIIGYASVIDNKTNDGTTIPIKK